MAKFPRVAVLRGASPSAALLALPAEGIELVADACFDYDGLERIETLLPEVVVLDIRGLRGSPTAPMAAVRRAAPAARLVVVGSPGDEIMARAALVAGASGYVSRDPNPAAILAAILGTARGEMHLTNTAQRVVQKMTSA